MTERPILFSGPMVRAILDGRKTQTRRIVKPQPQDPSCFGTSPIWGSGTHTAGEHRGFYCLHAAFNENGRRVDRYLRCPYGKPGDRLWVRETWRAPWGWDAVKPSLIASGTPVQFVADTAESNHDAWDKDEAPSFGKFRPSIFMPRWASRITLEVTAVRVERLQKISEEDAKAEGLAPIDVEVDGDHLGVVSARDQFAGLWDSINGSSGPGSWDANPWVWVVEFRRVLEAVR